MSFLRVACRASALTRPRFSAATFVRPRIWLPPRAAFSAAAGLSKEDITTRVLDVLKGFEKVDHAKVCFL
jgi:NADH dehydrogenase (ubiquinone) 1 alpha/beta subcomplex 1, acyl-carrier protein